MAMSTYLRRAFLNHLLRTATLAKKDFLYCSLHTADPTPDGSGTEVSTSGTGYARQPIAVLDASWSAPADASGYMASHNLNPVTFDAPTGNQGTPSHWGLFDQVTGGNLWYYGPIDGTLRLIDVGTSPVSFAAQSLNIKIGQIASDYLETAWLNHTLRTATFSKPANVYAGWHDVSPTDAGGVGEFTGTGYARVAIAVADASWSAPATEGDAEKVTNAGLITWPSPGADWGTYNYVSLSDAASAGNLLVYMETEHPELVINGDSPPVILPGAWRIYAS